MDTPIGFIISWSVPAVVAVGDLRNGITQAGLDPLDLAPDLRPASLVARSASFIARTTSGKDQKKLARKLDHMTRQITREDATPGSLTYTREAGIAYDDATGKLATDDPTIGATLDQTAQHILDTRTASDVTRIVQRIVEGAGSDLIPVREQGGAYFVPQGAGIIPRIRIVLEAIGGGLTMFACTLGHGSEASVANTITDYMLKQIAELQQSVEELNEKGIRADVKSRRLTRVAELRERVGAYAALVTTQGSKLTEAIDRAEAALLAKLGPSRDDEEAADAARVGQGELVMAAK
jgi:hypothetical protein